MEEKYLYYTLQDDYTLNSLEKEGKFSSSLENNYYLIDFFKHHYKVPGVVYYFKVRSYITEAELPTSGRGNHLIKLNGKTLSSRRVEYSANNFSKALLLCDALCENRFILNNRLNRKTVDDLLPLLIKDFGIDFNFFQKFYNAESEMYIGLVDEIKQEDIIGVIRDFRNKYRGD